MSRTAAHESFVSKAQKNLFYINQFFPGESIVRIKFDLDEIKPPPVYINDGRN